MITIMRLVLSEIRMRWQRWREEATFVTNIKSTASGSIHQLVVSGGGGPRTTLSNGHSWKDAVATS